MSRKKEIILYVSIFVFVFLLVFGCTRVYAADNAIFETDGDSIRFTDQAFEVGKKLLPDQVTVNDAETVYTFVEYAVNFVAGNTIGAAQSVASDVVALYDASVSSISDILDFFSDWTISDDGIIKYGRNGKFREINDEAMRLYGLNPGGPGEQFIHITGEYQDLIWSTFTYTVKPRYAFSGDVYFASYKPSSSTLSVILCKSPNSFSGLGGWQSWVRLNGSSTSYISPAVGASTAYMGGSYATFGSFVTTNPFSSLQDLLDAFFGEWNPGGENGNIILNNNNPNNSVNIRALPTLPTNQIVINHDNDSVGFPTSQTQNINIDYTFNEPYYPASDPIDYDLPTEYDYQNLDVNFDSYDVPQGVNIVQDFWDHTPSEVTTYIIACMSISACFMFFRG